MAENDIYKNKERYENFRGNLDLVLLKPRKRKDGTSTYYCKNKANLRYFRILFAKFEAKDLSYIRRVSITNALRMIVSTTTRDLAEINDKEGNRNEVNRIIASMHKTHKTVESKRDFIKDLKCIWRVLFPEKDEKGRIDETLVPYVVRHLSPKIDKSKEKRRKDKLTFEEFERILQFFSNDAQMQFYLAFSNESLVRPQEACYIRVSDVMLEDNHVKIYLSEHGKEGVNGFLRCIDSFPYLIRWLEKHPYRNDKGSFLFLIEGGKSQGKQQKPYNFSKRLKYACKKLGIDKNITAYSLKRNGVSFKRLAGYSDAEIQHIARWTSTKQLKTYDLIDSDETFKIALMKRGLIESDGKNESLIPDLKECFFCGKQNAFTNLACDNCKRPLDRRNIEAGERKKETEISDLKSQLDELKEMVMKIAKVEIKDK
ncbi:MAG: site-specific integrase [Nanoarchaeota archaeon]|nr:site-specific integrase [Nanoarchaeota archaeon]